jgi:AcrR family transcriptional regulator
MPQSSRKPPLETNSKSDQTQQSILDAAGKVLIEEGYSGFTMRRVSTAANISIGNLNYHYPTKSVLIDALLQHITDRIILGFDQVVKQAGESPELRMRAVLEYWIDDLQTVETSVFFPEIWALSNHHDFARKSVLESYQHALSILAAYVHELNPSLSLDAAERIGKFMCASMEGLTVFIGHKKMWHQDHAALKHTTIESFINLIKSG